MRWGISNNLSLTGTANPDFSQVESDAGQLLFDPRDERFFQEKRPFFLDGIEQFTTPNNLIYTRRVVQPVAAAKLTGKVPGHRRRAALRGGRPQVSADGQDHPLFNILRLQRDVGAESRIGVVYTDRIEGGDYSRLARADARLVFGKIYSVQLQLAGSSTRLGGESFGGPLWMARVERQRPDLRLAHQHPGEQRELPRPQRVLPPRRAWSTVNFDPRAAALRQERRADGERHFRREPERPLALPGLRLGRRDHGRAAPLQPQLHAAGRLGADRLAPARDLRLPVRDLRRTTGSSCLARRRCRYRGVRRAAPDSQPRLRPVGDDARVQDVLRQRVHPLGERRELLRVVARADHHRQRRAELASDRPGPGRGTYALQEVRRRSDGSLVNRQHIPRVKLEYQLSRPIFLRVVGEYLHEQQTPLRDDTRTEARS